MKQKKSFSLTEILIAMAIGTMVLMVVMQFFRRQTQDMHEGTLRNTTSHEVNYAIGYLEKDLKAVKMNRKSPENTIVKNQDGKDIAIIFEKYDEGTDKKICYIYNNETGYLLRTADSESMVLAKHISHFSILPNAEKTGLRVKLISSFTAANTGNVVETKGETTVFLRENYFYSLDKNWNKNDDIHGLFNIKGDVTFKEDIVDIADGIKNLPQNEYDKLKNQCNTVANNIQNFDSLFTSGVNSDQILANIGQNIVNNAMNNAQNAAQNAINNATQTATDTMNNAVNSVTQQITNLEKQVSDLEAQANKYTDQIAAKEAQLNNLMDKMQDAADDEDEDLCNELKAQIEKVSKESQDLSKKREDALKQAESLTNKIDDYKNQLNSLTQ